MRTIATMIGLLPAAVYAHPGPAWHLHDYPALPFALAAIAVVVCAAHLLAKREH